MKILSKQELQKEIIARKDEIISLINEQHYDFDASRAIPTSEENRPVNVGVKYLIKAE